jgi:hypothetical protein
MPYGHNTSVDVFVILGQGNTHTHTHTHTHSSERENGKMEGGREGERETVFKEVEARGSFYRQKQGSFHQTD